jgi:hypothetical protein
MRANEYLVPSILISFKTERRVEKEIFGIETSDK